MAKNYDVNEQAMKDRVRMYRTSLVGSMDGQQVMDLLVEAGLFHPNLDSYEYIMHREHTKSQRNRDMLDAVVSKGPGCMVKFVTALAEVGMTDLAKLIVGEEPVDLPVVTSQPVEMDWSSRVTEDVFGKERWDKMCDIIMRSNPLLKNSGWDGLIMPLLGEGIEKEDVLSSSKDQGKRPIDLVLETWFSMEGQNANVKVLVEHLCKIKRQDVVTVLELMLPSPPCTNFIHKLSAQKKEKLKKTELTTDDTLLLKRKLTKLECGDLCASLGVDPDRARQIKDESTDSLAVNGALLTEWKKSVLPKDFNVYNLIIVLAEHDLREALMSILEKHKDK